MYSIVFVMQMSDTVSRADESGVIDLSGSAWVARSGLNFSLSLSLLEGIQLVCFCPVNTRLL